MLREVLKEKHRIVIKVGSSSLVHKTTQEIDYRKLDQLVRVISDIKSLGKAVVLVTSGAQIAGRKAMSLMEIPPEMPHKQALAAIGQAKLMMVYQRLFSEYNQVCAQILLTKFSITDTHGRTNAINTFETLLQMSVIPIVNENDTVATEEIEFGDNDYLSALVLSMIQGDLLIILSDIDGLYTDDPTQNPDAVRIETVEALTKSHQLMGKSTSSSGIGTGGMASKIKAARIVTEMGADMVLASGADFRILYDILDGKDVGTFFKSAPVDNFDILDYMGGSLDD